MKAELMVDAPIMGQKKIWVKEICKPHFDHAFHYHQLCELVWLEKSHGKLIIGDYVGNFSENELILKSAGLPHLWRCDADFYHNNAALYTKATTTYFPPNLIPEITDDPTCNLLYSELMAKAARGLRFYGETRKAIIGLVRKMAVSEAFEQLSYFLKIMDIITHTNEYELLASVCYKNVKSREDLDRFNNVYHFLLENFDKDIRLREVSAVCNMAPNSFCRFFKSKTKKTFVRFLNELRVGHACKLLQNEFNSVKDICYNSGYNNPVNFFKFFKLITGMTPMEYRKKVRQMMTVEGG
jgi:AraC-like DNA-binding protein